MKPNEIVELPHVDEDGYFDGFCACMADDEGELMLGADAYNIAAPTDDGRHFYKLSADKTSWVAEAIPTTPEEAVGIVLDHHKQTKRVHQLRQVFEDLTKGSSTYRIHQDPETNARSIEKIPEKTLDEVRAEKMRALDSAFTAWYTDGATLKSSLGFEADSDSRAMQDVTGLVTAAEAMAAAETAETKLIFMDANNQGHEVGLSELETLRLEIIQAGQAAYKEKWSLRDAIDVAKTKEELDAIEIVFHPADFSAAA